VALDPGVLCPNSSLEAIAWRAPQAVKDLKELPELKGWFRREFGGEVTQVSKDADAEQPAEQAPRPQTRSGRSRGGRGRSQGERRGASGSRRRSPATPKTEK
jgi:hypothetical protein